MSNLIFVSGGFSSGTTLLFTLFRKAGDYCCLYEPLHEKLLQYLVYPLRPDPHHHPLVGSYFTEYRGFREIPNLFNPAWGTSGLYLPQTADADDLYRYLSYLIGTAFGRKPKVVLKENRITFRLGWLRSRFPHARIIHIYRDEEEQWSSIVRRGQEYFGREDVGQASVDFAGFNVARWCDDLKGVYPELEARNFRTGRERFGKLWELSFAEHRRYADISINLADLAQDFPGACRRIGDCIGGEFDVPALERLVVPADQRDLAPIGPKTRKRRLLDLTQAAGEAYARAWLRARRFLHRVS